MNVILGTAGHIDHGKSSLVKALTGVDPDRLPEEKARGVTIELGFAHLTIPHPKGHADFQVGVIDVPGHADFINNMVAGVGALDVVLFVVAADDCWMPQSEEHLHVLNYLGVTNAVIALTKSDICEDIEFTTEILREELEGSPLEDAPIIPVSSHTGAGLDELRKELASRFYTVTSTRSTADNGRVRLSVDRCFSPQGVGTVVTGTLAGSSVSIGDSLELQPEGITCHVRQIQNHNSQLETGLPSMRTALNVPDLPIAERGKPGVHRGTTLVAPDSGPTTQTVDVHIQRINRQIPGQSQSLGPLKLPRKIIVHMGTAHLSARLISLDQTELMPGDSAFCELRFDSPAHCFIGDRFVIRDASKLSTLGGGIVLDPLANRRRFHHESQFTLLEKRLEAPVHLDVILSTALQRDHILSAKQPLTLIPFSEKAVQKSIAKLKKTGKLILIGDFIVSPSWWDELSKRASSIITSYHEVQPDQPGIEIVRLIAELKDLLTSEKSADLLVLGLSRHGFVKRGDQIASEDHHLSLPPELESAAAKVMSALNASPLTPPTRSAVITTHAEEKAYAFLLRSKEVVELEPKVIISTTAFNTLKESTIAHLTAHGEATAGQLRDATGTTRKVLMPFLERLDSLGVTRRQGDVRLLK